ncbi:hypothetical protein CQ052_09755 [Ochrobactrum sp. MYb15]|nr:hypothetical protein CQZ90_18610 [Ochrobactrum sp. MYb19]PRA53522.1 hypothetical protein CQ062_15705 [Ochrobactrum sp. MYb68]PRA62029.1 hypothetical protein CQ053_18635 [Ochrobactrum sp. MYb18]PRA77565.1 hypothetical protein CQ049_09755 [Brucella thiophenivorans]PRA87392.1 hypothetical protein CQ051_18520 [Ochrobactrum sp. MYb14]PRA99575.1 hypothetical protein CQ052_09755 [Ochrobactrum sp. MYb15]
MIDLRKMKAALLIATYFHHFYVTLEKVNSYCFRFIFILFRIMRFGEHNESAEDGTKLLGMPEASSCIKLIWKAGSSHDSGLCR